jgi:4-amino-4-deoxy-L-arabinose transferase-like glycosyltransferase
MSIRHDVIGAIQGTIPDETASRQQISDRIVDWGLLPLLMVLAPLIYFFRVQHNLPLAANVDERTALDIFRRFQTSGLNPHFFLYPTLYYYVTYFFTRLFPPSMILVAGRILNLAFVGLTAFVAYSFCRLEFRSRAAGILSAFFVLASPTVVNSGSYICSDALLAATVLGSLLFLIRYFEVPTFRSFLIAMCMLGIAVGCKYTALVLFFAYAGTEMIRVSFRDSDGVDSERRVPRKLLIIAFAALGLMLLISAWALPVADLIRFATTHHTNPDLKSSADYLLFFQHVRKVLLFGSAALVISALLASRSDFVYRLLSLRRLYLGFGIILSIAALTTPYSILDAPKFLYDLGAQARATVMLQDGERQWRYYYSWLGNESRVLLLSGLIGFATIALRNYRRYLVVILFVAVYVFSIGNAHIGFPRYLTPLLPLIYVFAAGFLVQLWTSQRRGDVPYVRVVAVLLVLAASFELFPKFELAREASKRTDEFWNSYHLALDAHPTKVVYAGYAPSAELISAGVPTTQISWASLASAPMGDQVGCGELLILDRLAAGIHHVAPERDSSVTILLDDPSGDYGQTVVQRAGCRERLEDK